MKVFMKLVSIIFMIFIQVSTFEAKSIDRCTFISTIVASTTPEARYEVLSKLSIFPEISPIISPAKIFLDMSIASPLDAPPLDISFDAIDPKKSNLDPFERSYSTLAEQFGVKVSEKGFNSFKSAIDEISISRAEACGGDDTSASISPSDTARIIEEFQTAYSSDEKDLHHLRHLFGQLLCLNSELEPDNPKKKKRLADDLDCTKIENCVCPPGGIHSPLTCSCQFFRCLDPKDDLKPILGFSMEQQCLAFVIDTTGSMRNEINQAKYVIHEFIRSEEEIGIAGCYVLVPFGDVGPNNKLVPKESIGPITVADTYLVGDLQLFYNATNNLTANGGGDEPEYALDAMQETLKIKIDEYEIMLPGSQIVVITDASSKRLELEQRVINNSIEHLVCIHFFLNNHLPDRIYRNIADQTHGTFIESLADWHLKKFINAQETCDYESIIGRKKRAVIYSLDTRHTFQVTRFTINLKLTIDAPAGTTVTITRPDRNESVVVADTDNFAVYKEKTPQPGDWHAIAEGAGSSVSVALTLEIDTTIVYLDYNEDSTISPIACSDGRIVVLTSQANNMEDVRLNLVDKFHQIQHSIPLSKCSGAFVSDLIYYPSGSFTYHLAGRDSYGINFNYDTTRNKVTFNAASYSLTSIGSSVADINDVTVLSFNLTNLNHFSSQFNFSVSDASGIRTQLKFNTSVIGSRESFVVDVDVLVIRSQISAGSHDLTLTATNGCDTLTATRSLALRPREVHAHSSECGCLNGGTCTTITRRGRTVTRCRCPSGYGGSRCQIEY